LAGHDVFDGPDHQFVRALLVETCAAVCGTRLLDAVCAHPAIINIIVIMTLRVI
jgi:hypothetical protein